ncbi:MAG TPA: phage protein Gp37 [Candidatus Angelobacter sp.]|nr:phage protein Gp37 [Candidatus Angelobacter sp.]
MPTQFRMDDCESGLIALLKASLPEAVQVSALSSKDFDEQGTLLAVPPAALVMFDSTQDQSRDITRKTYQTYQDWVIFVGSEDLRDVSTERGGAQDLVQKVRAALAGQRIPLDGDSSFSGPIELAGTTAEQFGKDGTWYSVRVRVEAIAQF